MDRTVQTQLLVSCLNILSKFPLRGTSKNMKQEPLRGARKVMKQEDGVLADELIGHVIDRAQLTILHKGEC